MPHRANDALDLLYEQAGLERDRIAAELRRADEVAVRARAQGHQLVSYRAEYVERWASQFGRGGAIEIVQCYQSFMSRLDEAIAHQQRQIEATEAGVVQLRRALVEAEVRVASVRKLVERRHQERLRLQARQEQRSSDETAQQIVVRRMREGLAALQH